MQHIRNPRSAAPHGPASSRFDVGSYLDRHARELEALLAGPTSGGIQIAQRSADIMDSLMRELYGAAIAVVGPLPPVTLAAVGGYGRRLLGWKSDLDVRFLTSGQPGLLAPLAEAILYPLWDAGVSVGHQVVTIDSAIQDARSDLPTATALLDFRPIAGDVALAHALNERMYEELFAPSQLAGFLDRLLAEVRARRGRLDDSAHLLEPDVKNGAGGLRDLDCALWATSARWRIGDLAELCRSGLLSAQELEATQTALELTWSVRNRLHRDAGRKSDRLTFAEQERIAEELGYAARAGVSADIADSAAIEATAAAFMSDYYRHARSLVEVSERILARAVPQAAAQLVRGPETPPGMCRYGNTLGLVDSACIDHDPTLALRLVAAAVEHQLPLHAPSREAIQRACAMPAFSVALRTSTEAAALFVDLVGQTRLARFRGESILAELQELGLLTALIPEFASVISKAHHDTYHVYTVDVHSVYAVDHLRALARGEGAGELSLASRLAQLAEDRELLLMAALLHDVGKARPGPGHAQRGADMARDILRRLRLPQDSIDKVCFLIREHLSMYKVALQRDLADPDTISDFARLVGSPRLLAQLYLITVADVRTTGPASMTTWKSHLLDKLYVATEAWFDGRGPEGEDMLRTGWALHDDAVAQFVQTMPARYRRASTPAEASMHARAAQAAAAGSVHIACAPSLCDAIAELCVVTPAETEATRLTVVAQDRSGLLALVAAALAANRLEICAAEVYTRRLGDGSSQAVDRFWVRAPNADLARIAARVASVERDLKRLLNSEISARALMEGSKPSRWGERAAPQVPARVIIDHDASTEFTVIEVLTKDQPGLLFVLAETLRVLGISIALAKISTQGARATDAFYVTEHTGEKLARGARTRSVEQQLLAALSFDAVLQTVPSTNTAGSDRYRA